MNRSARWGGRDHHPPCPGGCGQLADECACVRPNPLGSMRISPPAIRFVDAPVRDWPNPDPPALEESTTGGCCMSCDGTGWGGPGSGPETNGRCWDCRASGHLHDGPCPTPSAETARVESLYNNGPDTDSPAAWFAALRAALANPTTMSKSTEVDKSAWCEECHHIHTPDGCTGPATPSDIWAGVSVESCDCDAGQS